MTKTVFSFLSILALSVHSTFAQDETTAPAVEVSSEKAEAVKALLDVMKMEEMMASTMSAGLDPQLQQMKKMGLSEAGLAKLKAEMMSFLEEVMSWESLEPEMIQIYADTFTVEELNAITDFYKTPVGQKLVVTMPDLTMKGMMLGQNRVQKNMPKLQERIMPIIQSELAPQQ